MPELKTWWLLSRFVTRCGILVALSVSLANAGTVGVTAAAPTSIATGAATTVTVTSVIADPTVIAGSVQLQTLGGNGTVTAIAGVLHDDGLNGDAVANDGTYTLQTTVLQNSPGTLTYRVSAAFQGSLLRAFSSPIAITVAGSSVAINIVSPSNLLYTSTSPVNVSGTVGSPTATVKINGINAPVTGGTFLATVPLVEGLNTLTAVATNTGASASTASVQVTLDTTPPHITIDSPQAGMTTTASSITVTGTANDIVVGTVNTGDVTVVVNGVTAQVANRTYAAANIPLTMGVNTIQAVGHDRAGNGTTVSATITRVSSTTGLTTLIGTPVVMDSLNLVSGNNQTGTIGQALPSPLVVTLTDQTGKAVASQPVVFTVTGNNGTVITGGASSPSAMATTDSNGRAQAIWTLGQRSGAGINTVQVTSSLAVGPASFNATGLTSGASMIVVDSGNSQSGALGQALAFPFVAVVTDSGHNRVPNVPVTFEVTQGGGTLNGALTQQVVSDSNGRAIVVLTLGDQPGNSNNVVQASFAGNPGLPVSFAASGLTPGNPANTTISGLVVDNSNNPIQGATIRLYQTNQANNNNLPMQIGTPVQTDVNGLFTIANAPVGYFKLMADGSTAVGGKSYPTVEFDIVTVAGQNNTLGMPISLPTLDTVNQLCVDATHGGTLTLPASPGFSLTVGAGSAIFPGGSQSGCISVSAVNPDKVPMAPGFGQQPHFIVTIQPVGTVFTTPAPITIPNADGLKPGAVTEMYSYDHDLSMFVAIGTGTVSADGSVIASNPGVGVLKAGWHCGGDPSTAGTVADCPTCQICDGTKCITDPAQDKKQCMLPTPGMVGICVTGTCTPISVQFQVQGGGALASPFKVGISASINRTQHLQAVVTPMEAVSNVTLMASGSLNLTNMAVSGNTITFDLVGTTKSAASGDATLSALAFGTHVKDQTVSVVVPAKVGTPHDVTGTLVVMNLVGDATTSPAITGLPAGTVQLLTEYVRFLTIGVTDQFGDSVGTLYQGSPISEYGGTSINQTLSAASSYVDPVGFASFGAQVAAGSAAAVAWPAQPQLPLAVGAATQNIPVEVDGFSLSPAIANRMVTGAPPSTITIVWP